MIPDFEDGVLPEGIYECTLEEIATIFPKYPSYSFRELLHQRPPAPLRNQTEWPEYSVPSGLRISRGRL